MSHINKTIVIFICILSVVIGLSACGGKAAVITPAPTNTPIPGWVEFSTSDVGIWLPESYVGGDLENDLAVITERLRALGPDYEAIAKNIEANPNTMALIAYDSTLGSTGFMSNVNIVKEPVVSAVTLDKYIEAAKPQLSNYFKIIDLKKVALNEYEAYRLVLEMDTSGYTAKELMYIVMGKNIVWSITYATGVSEFEDRLPEFEQSANTFYMQP